MSTQATASTASLLPPGSTALERALEKATERVADVPTPFEGLWNADTCPAELLGWLAWATSVDEWDPTWPESVKREAIRMAPLLHQRKGTVWALENALNQFGMGTKVKEWWAMKPTGAPGTFELVTHVTPANSQALTPDLYAQMARVIAKVKPKSRTFSMTMAMTVPSHVHITSHGTATIAAFTGGVAEVAQTHPSLVLDFVNDPEPALSLDFERDTYQQLDPLALPGTYQIWSGKP
jgi:phage tail P2-like protein